MQVTDPVVMFLLILSIGIIAGLLFDRLAGPSWLARQFSGSNRGMITSALVGVAGAFVGYHIALLLGMQRRDSNVSHCRSGWSRCRAVRLANGQITAGNHAALLFRAILFVPLGPVDTYRIHRMMAARVTTA